MAEPVDIDDLILSYRRSLIAKVQEHEFQSWGPSTTDVFRKTIADHQSMEQAYVLSEVGRRSKESQQ